ncbi:MAG: glutathione S-transferase family protein [Rickettsiales bacterium]|jgi:glutathione S-transferase|nr:glutathione S-transferase family protein [Rickettsiales bacterium]
MKLVLYHYTLCPFSRKIRFLLEELKIKYVKKEIEFWKDDKIFEVNITPECPVLHIEKNNVFIQDSYLISEYLIDIANRSDLYGDEPLKVKRLTMLSDKNFYNDVTGLFLYEKIYNHLGKVNCDNIEIARKNMKKYLLIIEKLLSKSEFVAGDYFTISDISISTQISTIDFLGEINFNKYPEIKRWYLLIKSKPSFDAILQDKNILIRPPHNYTKVDF